jgi:hypothetical protein
VLNVIGRLVALESSQADLLGRISSGPTITAEALRESGALTVLGKAKRKTKSAGSPEQRNLLD